MSFKVPLYQIQKEGKVILETQVVLPSVLELSGHICIVLVSSVRKSWEKGF